MAKFYSPAQISVGEYFIYHQERYYLLDTSSLIVSPSKEEIEELITTETKHKFYQDTVKRADVMSLFFNADKKDKVTMEKTFKKSIIESDDDYDARIQRMSLLPIEKSMVSGVARIYQGHHSVERKFPDSDGWKYMERHYDDKGGSIEQFYRHKVLVSRQVLGFGAVIMDLLARPDGNAFTDTDGKVIPYAYLVRPHELWNYEMRQGKLSYMLIAQESGDYTEFKGFTKDRIYRWRKKNVGSGGDGDSKDIELEQLPDVRNRFKEVPARLIKGEPDLDSGFEVGRPARWHVAGAYKALNELFYDLNESSLLFAHPVEMLHEDTVKQMRGAVDNEGNIDYTKVQAKLGAVGIYSGQDVPKELFWQADMQGLQHLKSYFFELIRWIHNWSNIRDKSQQVANNSGVSKAMDTVEERGMLATVAQEQEDLERDMAWLAAKVRGEEKEIKDDAVIYQKEFDLTTPEETFKYLQEGMQYSALKPEAFKYLTLEFLRKVGAPQDIIRKVESQIRNTGMPIQATYEALRDIFDDNAEIAKRMFPELVGKSAYKDKLRDEPLAIAGAQGDVFGNSGGSGDEDEGDNDE